MEYTEKKSCAYCGCIYPKDEKKCPVCDSTTYIDYNPKDSYKVTRDKMIQARALAQQQREFEENKPTIITCPACNKQVSNQAPSCPHCGQPIDTRPKCPTCGSPDIKKLTAMNRGASFFIWGSWSNKFNKSWQCNKCGQTW